MSSTGGDDWSSSGNLRSGLGDERETAGAHGKCREPFAVINQLLAEDHAKRRVLGLTLAPQIRRG